MGIHNEHYQLEYNLLNSRLIEAFNPNLLMEILPSVSTLLSEILKDKRCRGLSVIDPNSLLEKTRSIQDSISKDRKSIHQGFMDIVELHIQTAIAVSSTGYIGRQYSSVPPLSAIYDLISALVPQPATFYEGGPLPNVADKLIAEDFGKFLGWEDNSFDLVSTSGASLANLTAVLTARNRIIENSWEQGNSGSINGIPTLAIGEDAHYSVERIAGIIGIGRSNVIRLPLDEKRRICARSAKEILIRAKDEGRNIFCVIASAGTTSIGTIDPLKEISDISKMIGAWFHVDAAHNGALLVSNKYRSRVHDLRFADSFCLDAHKTLFVPAACTLLFYKDKNSSRSPFPAYASYVHDFEEDEVSRFESGTKNFECTKRPAILNLWVMWTLYGREFFEDKINLLISISNKIYKLIESMENFYVLQKPEFNILCFQYRPPLLEKEFFSNLQRLIRKKLVGEGSYFISKVDIGEECFLRLVIMNHEINTDVVQDMLMSIVRIGDEIISNNKHLNKC